ncbi:gamma-glutamate-cysteine ligase [Wigglesworthia glossinidia endosymbiont of Glossina morsitans morsitans (Yale colony)]|uniref:Glutamate--cysteine ligase n=1 Tax=Wigglesworthia glossinidia endosymbiont of Glossina morsitans morsitans (Yale colony) TaxID=1142511 RepID=H6Q570_WIGGL|nr:glutamate--cysteine ligase [Wigglesworthia glossinidia]AFA41353.1 gamma-glutamate-cysteine ligase [Wigglesworthia glossinidia endosymbiont of Glossina morsitans morsitans (Yale colony)]
MLPTASKIFPWIKENSEIFKIIFRGIERETLRVDYDGNISKTLHPKLFGSPLTHNWITTDFAESLLELITPVNKNIENMINFLQDLHKFVTNNLHHEFLWPMSMPCKIKNELSILIAQYGNSELGKIKNIYRFGLKNRYGARVQIISGIHYNISFSKKFWNEYHVFCKKDSIKMVSSEGYLNLIRNYYRLGWIMTYYFGASPVVHSSFLKKINVKLPFKKNKYGDIYLPYATSLRLSEIGYINKVQKKIKIKFNNLTEYIEALFKATQTPYSKYQKIGIKKNKRYLQLNTNLLQKVNELYTPIRPKRTLKINESLFHALHSKGIEYVEIRSLDINPFSPIGLKKHQIYFLDLFLIWCILVQSPPISNTELKFIHENWNRVALKGRKPNIKLISYLEHKEKKLSDILKNLLQDLQYIAEILYYNKKKDIYKKIFHDLFEMLEQPNMTLSGKVFRHTMDVGFENLGLKLAKSYQLHWKKEKLKVLSEKNLKRESKVSLHKQKIIENKN